jgi:hypothetical protein
MPKGFAILFALASVGVGWWEWSTTLANPGDMPNYLFNAFAIPIYIGFWSAVGWVTGYAFSKIRHG